MPFTKSILDGIMQNRAVIVRAANEAYKSQRQERIMETRDAINMYYGRQVQILKRDILLLYKSELTQNKMIGFATPINLTKRILDESSLALAESPTLRISTKAEEDAQKKRQIGTTAKPAKPRAADSGTRGAGIALPRLADGVASPASANAEGPTPAPEGSATEEAGESPEVELTEESVKPVESPLTRIWNEKIDPERRFWSQRHDTEKLSYLVNDVQTWIFFRNTANGSKIVWQDFTPDTYAIIQDPESPSDPILVLLEAFYQDCDPNLFSLSTRLARSMWTKDEVRILNDRNEDVTPTWLTDNKGGANPFGFLPMAIFRSSDPEPGSYYGAQASDLVAYNRQINLKETALRYIEELQGFGVPFAQGLSKENRDNIQIGPDSVVYLESDGTSQPAFGFAAPSAPIEALHKRKQGLIREIAEQYGLDGNALLNEGGAKVSSSGKAKQMDNQRLLDRTMKQRERMVAPLTELIRKTFIVWKFYNPDDPDAALIPDDMTQIIINIRYPELARKLDDPDQYALRTQKVADGLYTWADMMMEEHPEIDDPLAAQAQLQANKQENAKAGNGAAAFTAALTGAQGAGVMHPAMQAQAAAVKAAASGAVPPPPPAGEPPQD